MSVLERMGGSSQDQTKDSSSSQTKCSIPASLIVLDPATALLIVDLIINPIGPDPTDDAAAAAAAASLLAVVYITVTPPSVLLPIPSLLSNCTALLTGRYHVVCVDKVAD